MRAALVEMVALELQTFMVSGYLYLRIVVDIYLILTLLHLLVAGTAGEEHPTDLPQPHRRLHAPADCEHLLTNTSNSATHARDPC